MKKKMHFASRMFLDEPYVVRIEHAKGDGNFMDLTEFRKTLRRQRSIMQATWGYTDPIWEKVSVNDVDNYFAWYSPDFYLRSYWVFSDELDALQFRLSVGESAKQMFIWPQNTKFTITEFINE